MRVVMPVVIPQFHLVDMTTLMRVAVQFAYPTGVFEIRTHVDVAGVFKVPTLRPYFQ